MFTTSTYKIVLGLLLIFGSVTSLMADFYVIPISKKMKNVITVAKSGGQFTELKNAISSISDASLINPYTIYIAAGTYTINDTIELGSSIHLVGSGRDSTILLGNISGGGTLLQMSANSSASNLSVWNSGTSSDYIAIMLYGASISLNNIYAYATGGSTNNIAIYAYSYDNVSTTANIHNCKADALTGDHAHALRNSNSNVTVTQSKLKSINATTRNYTVYTTAGGNTYIKSSQILSTSSTQNAEAGVVADGVSSYNGVMYSELEKLGKALNSGRNSCFFTMISDDPMLFSTYRYVTENCSDSFSTTPGYLVP